jgi:phosphoserine phosphatase
MTTLHLFDVDGTLLYGSAASVEISRQLGVTEEILELEHSFASGGMRSSEFAVRVRELWADLTEAHVEAAFEGAPWLAGIREVWADIRASGGHSAAISLSPAFFVKRLLDWGLDVAHGSRFPSVPFSEPVDPADILSAAAKVTIADELRARFRVSREQCVVYGDSVSDMELFAVMPVSVAVNGDRHLDRLATHRYTGRDLREAYELVRTPPA